VVLKGLSSTLLTRVVFWLQQYNLRKKSEHALKSMMMDSRLISVADPRNYADRFCRFMSDLFVARDKSS
jgi:hypothetical protein